MERSRVAGIFKSKEAIIDLSQNCELYNEANILMKRFAFSKEIRDLMYITLDDLNAIFRFKLRGQFNRQAGIRKSNEEQLIRRISELALNIDTGDDKYNTEIKIKLLSSLRGIHTATASAILTLIYPQEFAIIDRRNWRTIFGTQKSYAVLTADLLTKTWVVNQQPPTADPEVIGS
jgi:hypothetical protein